MLPVHFNVATLLREPVGSTRHIEVPRDRPELAEVPALGYRRPAWGDVRLLRTARGILVRAQVHVVPAFECARCLVRFEAPATLHIDELFAWQRDPVTQEPVRDLDPDDFRLRDEQYLDLSEAIRQYEETARPISPLCRPDCRGLCPVCGQDRNQRDCACQTDEMDHRLSALAGLADRLRATEEHHGRPEA